MSKSKQPVTITGFATCVVGARAGHDGDECRANATSDGGIFCVICGTTYPKAVVEVFEAARGIDLRVTRIQNGSAITRDMPAPVDTGNPHVLHISPYDAACLSGHDPAQFEITRIGLALPDGVTGEIKYTPEDAAAAANPTDNFGQEYAGSGITAVPESTHRFAVALARLGFRVSGHVHDMSGHTLKLSKGHGIIGSKIVEDPAGGGRGKSVPDPTKVCVFGVAIELHWR